MAKSTVLKFIVAAAVSFCFSYIIQIHTFAQQKRPLITSSTQHQTRFMRTVNLKIQNSMKLTENNTTASAYSSVHRQNTTDTPTSISTTSPSPTVIPFPTNTPVPTLTPVPEDTKTPIQQTSFSLSPEEQDTVYLINQQRSTQNLPPLSINVKLSQAAKNHSEYMKSNNCFDHQCPGEADFCGRISACGYGTCRGETIAAGQQTSQDVFSAWMNSASHKAILMGDYGSGGEIGISKVSCDSGCTYSTYWTADVGQK